MKTLVALAAALSTAALITSVSAAGLENAAPPGVAAPQRAAPGDLGMAIMSAVVAANGTLVRGEGATASTLDSTGNFVVSFGRDVTACAYVASTGLTGPIGNPAPAYATAAGRLSTPNALYISTFDATGANVSFAFHVLVYCGR